MDQSVNDASHCEYSTDDGTDVDQELRKVLSGVRIVDCHGRHFVVEYDDVFIARSLMLLVHFELEHLRREPVAEAEVALKDGRYSLDCEHRL